MTRSRFLFWLLALLVTLGVALLLGSMIAPRESLHALLSVDGDPFVRNILLHVRLPRLLVAALVGGALGASGAALQGLFRNPLADPSILGVSAAAALFAQAAIFLGLVTFSAFALPVFAIAGALLATVVLASLLRATRGETRELLVLGGVALAQVMAAASALLVSLAIGDYSRAQRLLAWMLGSLDGRTWTHVLVGSLPTFFGVFFLTREGRRLDALGLGDLTATSLGVDVPRVERRVILLSAILSGLSVALAGIIGFVGLLVPHLARRLVGASHRRVILESSFLGALLLVSADALARRLLAPLELSVGVLSSAFGAPCFAWILFRRLGPQR